ncbi:MAG: YitT family protein [Clostridia bacterium]|nr:YitT family protein [Clostridia bacterium]
MNTQNEKTEISEAEVAPVETERPLPPKITRAHINQRPNKKQETLYWAKTVFLLLSSAFLLSFSSYSIIAPNNFAIGGITGLAIIFERIIKLPQSITIISLNLPLLILAFFKVKKKFAIMSLLDVALQSLFLFLMENLGMPRLDFGEQQIFAALAGGIGIGTAIGFAFKIGGSTGGMDIVAVMVQKKFPAPSIAWMIFILNCVVIAASFFVYKDTAPTLALQLLPLIKAACEQYVESKVNDAINNGVQSAIEFRVITDKPEELSYAILSRLGRGVTEISAKGMYTKEAHSMLVCVISRRQITAFKKVIKEVDPDSFAVMSRVSQVLGLGFFTSEE